VRRLIERLALGIAAVAVVACGPPPPRITFTEIPSAAHGGPIRTATIAGRVDGARPGDRIVLYAKSGTWFVQPLRTKPFTPIDAQGLWRSTIHLGTEYAAIVVREEYRPPTTAKVLPDLSDHVVAIATVNGGGDHVAGAAAPLQFSGYEWKARERISDRGGRNQYAAANASVDADGALHLKLARRDDQPLEDQWTSAGACLTRPLGYGTYVFIVRDVAGLDPAARLALFTFDENARADHFREMNIDLWSGGEPGASNDSSAPGGQFVLQPNYLPGNLHRFTVPAGRVSHTMRWEPGVVAFKSMRGNFLEQPGAAIASRTFTTGVPGPGDERVCMAFYFYRKGGHEPRADNEIVIERFQYLP
jgi:hypothetical protein